MARGQKIWEILDHPFCKFSFQYFCWWSPPENLDGEFLEWFRLCFVDRHHWADLRINWQRFGPAWTKMKPVLVQWIAAASRSWRRITRECFLVEDLAGGIPCHIQWSNQCLSGFFHPWVLSWCVQVAKIKPNSFTNFPVAYTCMDLQWAPHKLGCWMCPRLEQPSAPKYKGALAQIYASWLMMSKRTTWSLFEPMLVLWWHCYGMVDSTPL